MSETKLNFSQRNGLAPLPTQLRADEISAELRAKLWAAVHSFIEEGKTPGTKFWLLDGSPARVLQGWWISGEHKPIDEWSRIFSTQVKETKELFYASKFNKLFDFLEYLLASSDYPKQRKDILKAIFEECRAAWRVVDGIIVPVSSSEESASVAAALSEVAGSGPSGARAHFKLAAARLSDGKWADSVRESIHGVEATAKSLGDGETLGEALKAINKGQQKIHPALLKGFLSIYGYTSDEKGVRHALVDEESSVVGEKEAVFMFGACASFAQYLIRMSRE